MSHIITKKIIFVRHGQGTHNTDEEYDPENIVLTDLGIEQAKKTGKYLKNTFDSFDCIYSSPVVRCKQTTNVILDELQINKEIKYDNNLIEIGEEYYEYKGMSSDAINKIMEKEGVNEMEKIYESIIDPYKRFEYGIKLYDKYEKLCKSKPNMETATKNLKIFLETLRESHEDNILVISHGGIMRLLQKMISNIDTYSGNDVILTNKIPIDNNNELFGNCACMYLAIINNEFKIISPMNTLHLI